MEKINVAELLKDCPEGMELDCTTWENVTLKKVVCDKIYIKRNEKNPSYDNIVILNQYGCITNHQDEKCRIFPKGKTTWEGFQRPFKDGDVVFYDNCVGIFKEWGDETLFRNYVKVDIDGKHPMLCSRTSSFGKGVKKEARFATEEEKEKLFQTIKDNGYKWNAETKTLEKPRFKVGDRIRYKKNVHINIPNMLITEVDEYGYKGVIGYTTNPACISFKYQDLYELIPNKFDITILKPFISPVLIRDYNDKMWMPAFWGKFLEEDFNCRYLTSKGCYKYCIPYEGNEHLLGTANDCDEYFKTWE